MKHILIGFILISTLFASCKKTETTPSNSLVGTWVFTNQLIDSYAYPSVFSNNPTPVGNSIWSTILDSIKITFDNSGNYTFMNFNLPVDYGKYTIVQDSFIVINPNTAGFIKFNYSLPTTTAGVGTPPVPVYSPYSTFSFSTDTILFKKPTDNNVIFSGVWLTKTNTPIIPSNGTLILNQSLNYFKRQ